MDTVASPQTPTRTVTHTLAVPHLIISRGSSERPISQLNELTVNLLKVVAVAAIILGFIFDLPKVMFFGLAVGILAFALHFVARSVPNESFVAEVLSFFWPSSTRHNSPTTPPAASWGRTVAGRSSFTPSLGTIEQSPDIRSAGAGPFVPPIAPLSSQAIGNLRPLPEEAARLHPPNRRSRSDTSVVTARSAAQRVLQFEPPALPAANNST